MHHLVTIYARDQTMHISKAHSMKKALGGEANTARWLLEGGAKNFAPPQTPFPWAQDGQNLIS